LPPNASKVIIGLAPKYWAVKACPYSWTRRLKIKTIPIIIFSVDAPRWMLVKNMKKIQKLGAIWTGIFRNLKFKRNSSIKNEDFIGFSFFVKAY
jgi:hypothetical protein